MKSLLILISSLGILGSSLVGGTALAQFGGLPKVPKIGSKTKPSDALRTQGYACEKSCRKGIREVPTNFSSSPDKRAKSLAKAEESYDAAKVACTDALVGMATYEGNKKRFDELTFLIEDARLQIPILAKYLPLKEKSKADERLDEAEVAELLALAKAYADGAQGSDQERYAKIWTKKTSQLAEGDKGRKAKYDAKHAQAAEDTEMLRKHAAVDDFGAIFEALKTSTRDRSAPIDPALYAKYEAQVKLVEAFNPTARLYYEPELKNYLAFDAWRKGKDAPDAIAKIYTGTIVAKGKSKGKKASIKIKTKADHCYMMLMNFTMPGGTQSLQWKKSLKTQFMQRFYLEPLTNVQRGNGFCMTKAQSLNYSGKLTFTGTKNSLQWVVLEWPRNELPAFFTTRTRRWVETCDPVQFEESWTKPVPGSIAHRKAGEIKSWDAAYPKSCTSDPERASYALAAKYSRCLTKVDQAYGPKIDRAKKARDNARTRGAFKAASKAVDRVLSKRSAAIGKKCEPTMKKIRKAYEKANDRVADVMMGEAYSDHIDRDKRRADEEAGHARPHDKDGKPESYKIRDKRIFRMKQYKEYYEGK